MRLITDNIRESAEVMTSSILSVQGHDLENDEVLEVANYCASCSVETRLWEP